MNAMVDDHDPRRGPGYRYTIFLYGLAGYFIGVIALVAMILAMLGVFKFSGGPVGGLGTSAALWLDFLLLGVFALQHSVMARQSFKARWTRIIPAAAERATYMLATGLALGLVLWLWQPMPAVVWSVETPWIRGVLIAVALGGWAYLLAASFAINHFELFGLQQVFQAFRAKPQTEAPFQERWMYRFDRHPIMSGLLIGIWATPTMTLDHLLFAAGSTVYICIGVHFEERALQRQWGDVYEDYRARVGTMVPNFARRTRAVAGAAHDSVRTEPS